MMTKIARKQRMAVAPPELAVLARAQAELIEKLGRTFTRAEIAARAVRNMDLGLCFPELNRANGPRVTD